MCICQNSNNDQLYVQNFIELFRLGLSSSMLFREKLNSSFMVCKNESEITKWTE